MRGLGSQWKYYNIVRPCGERCVTLFRSSGRSVQTNDVGNAMSSKPIVPGLFVRALSLFPRYCSLSSFSLSLSIYTYIYISIYIYIYIYLSIYLSIYIYIYISLSLSLSLSLSPSMSLSCADAAAAAASCVAKTVHSISYIVS